MSVNFINGDSVFPGQILGKISEKIIPGAGVTIKGTKYISLLRGKAYISNPNPQNLQTISIETTNKTTPGINLNDEVLARVQKIKQETVFVNVICVNNNPISIELEGVIKRKDVREKEVDKIEMEECFIPGDIVKAYVASYGDSRRIQLRTCGDNFGVVYARNSDTGNLMFPVNFEEMVCPVSNVREKRKVAMPDFGDYEEVEEEKMKEE